MKPFFLTLASWAVQHRSKLPGWMQRSMESIARNPDSLVAKAVGSILLPKGDIKNTIVPETQFRIYIAPTNYSGQGFAWARALEKADPDLAARNLEVELPGGYAFNSDNRVPLATVNVSAAWAAAEWQAASQFTHVLVEAERSMFGKQFDRDLESEITALRNEGVSVAMMCHGTDIRDPDQNARLTPWSPFPEDPRTDILREDARKNHALLQRVQCPIFVSTPDLLLDVPNAVWCPVIVDSDRFRTDTPAFVHTTVRIVHSSSNNLQKGSHLISPALSPLVELGDVEYEAITKAPSNKMPQIFEGADIVLDQFRVGSYGTAACEAMAAGRLVIGHVLPSVRRHVEEVSGMPLPILEATPETLRQVVRDVLQDKEAARAFASKGPEFVAQMHDGKASANALLKHWIHP